MAIILTFKLVNSDPLSSEIRTKSEINNSYNM